MKRLLAIAAVLLAGIALVVFATGSSSDSGGYKVRAIFDSAAFVIPGMDVQDRRRRRRQHLGDRPDGRQEGRGRPQHRRTANYHDFRKDAFCTIRPQSLIGERYVECEPTQPQLAGSPKPPLLRQIESGPGEGEYLLPATNTARSVDLDLINNIMRLPFRQRFTIFLNEFGTGLAGNGAAAAGGAAQVQPGAARSSTTCWRSSPRRTARSRSSPSTATRRSRRSRASARSVAGFINSSAKTAQRDGVAQRGARGELHAAAAVPARARARR